MKIESAKFQNFRCLKDTVLDVDPSLTVLIGPNGIGKSSILEGIAHLASLQTTVGEQNRAPGRLVKADAGASGDGFEIVIVHDHGETGYGPGREPTLSEAIRVIHWTNGRFTDTDDNGNGHDRRSAGERTAGNLVDGLRERLRNGPALILIDDIDAHLHPSRHCEILREVMRVAGDNQVIVTTHSPLLTSAVEAERIRIITPPKNDPDTVAALHGTAAQDAWKSDPHIEYPMDSKGRSANRALFCLFHTPNRDPDIQALCDTFYKACDDKDADAAEGILAELRRRVEGNPIDFIGFKKNVKNLRATGNAARCA